MVGLKDTLIPKKPEDFEPAIQQDINFLKAEVDRMLTGTVDPNPIILNLGGTLHPTNKCTCPIKIESKKRKRSGKITIKRQDNGYGSGYCPIHNSK